MAKCFVIQPFDRGPFDKRYDDVLAPTIQAAGLEPYRVDRDPSANIPIDAIIEGIKGALVCVADISVDNPNVWFELGVAIATNTPLVLLCDVTSRTHFPFDVQHRYVITYKRESVSDFEALAVEVKARIEGVLEKAEVIEKLVGSPLNETEGLEPHEVTALALIAENDLDRDAAPVASRIKEDMSRAGYTPLAAVLAVKALQSKGLVEEVGRHSFDGEPYTAFVLTSGGVGWLMRNQEGLALKRIPRQSRQSSFEDFPE